MYQYSHTSNVQVNLTVYVTVGISEKCVNKLFVVTTGARNESSMEGKCAAVVYTTYVQDPCADNLITHYFICTETCLSQLVGQGSCNTMLGRWTMLGQPLER